MFVCCECCVLSGRGLCDELITSPEESYRLRCVVVCGLETPRMRRPWSKRGCCPPPRPPKKTNKSKDCTLQGHRTRIKKERSKEQIRCNILYWQAILAGWYKSESTEGKNNSSLRVKIIAGSHFSIHGTFVRYRSMVACLRQTLESTPINVPIWISQGSL